MAMQPRPLGSAAAAVLLALSGALSGCDPQAGVGYLGQPLFRMTGSVEIGDDRPDGQLVPALAFLNRSSSELYFIDVEAEGEFPAEFTLDVFDPPPSGAFTLANPLVPDDPKIAGGYITAVVEDHPDSLRLGVPQAGFGELSPQKSVSTSSWCTPDGSECYKEVETCPQPEGMPCTVERSGDPALKEDAFEQFAGFSENYRVIYVDEPVPADSYTAHLMQEPDGLDPGYYLFQLSPFSDAEQADLEACWSDAAGLATERYNDEHDTDYAQQELENAGVGCMTSLPCPPGGTCDTSMLPPDPPCREVPAELLPEFERLHERAKLDLDCPLTFEHVKRVQDPAHESIAVRIGQDLGPQATSSEVMPPTLGSDSPASAP